MFDNFADEDTFLLADWRFFDNEESDFGGGLIGHSHQQLRMIRVRRYLKETHTVVGSVELAGPVCLQSYRSWLS